MKNFVSKKEGITYKQNRIVRVISYFKNNGRSVGSGFLINNAKNILTCWHVICGSDLKNVLESELFSELKGKNEVEKIDKYYRSLADKIEVELYDGVKIPVKLDSYDYFYDLAILEVPSQKHSLPYFDIELKETLDYADEVLFLGYPIILGYDLLTSPFSVNSGTISSFPDIEISGGKYKMIQLTGICIGGNSGAPVFKKESNKPIAVLNGYEWKGYDNMAILKDDSSLETKNLRVPINISYATGFAYLLKKSQIFKKLIEKL